MKERPFIRRWFAWLGLGFALILIYRLCDELPQNALSWAVGVFAPFILGAAVAFLLFGPCRFLENLFKRFKGKLWKKLARPLSIILVYLLLVGVLALIVYLVAPMLVNSVTDLVARMPEYIDTATAKIDAFAHNGFLEKLHLSDRLEDFGNGMADTLMKMLNAENLLTALGGVLSAASGILDVGITFIFSIYILAGREKLAHDVTAVLGLFCKAPAVRAITDYAHRIADICYSYFYGAFLDALLVGAVLSIVLLIFGVPYAILLGMGIGLMNMIPYFGPLIGAITVILTTLLTKGFYVALGVTACILIVQQIDGNIVQPRIVGGSVGIRPIYVLLGILVFGDVFGFWGIFLAVPLMAVTQMFVKDAIRRKKEKEAPPAPATPTEEEEK